MIFQNSQLKEMFIQGLFSRFTLGIENCLFVYKLLQTMMVKEEMSIYLVVPLYPGDEVDVTIVMIYTLWYIIT